MKKSELLKLLADVPDDGEVYLWNGLVGDWMDIGKIVPTELVKMTQSTMVEYCRLEKCQDNKDWSYQQTAEEIQSARAAWYRNYKWEFNDYVTQEDIAKGRYKAKNIYLISAKTKGVTTWDRAGDISY